jgi:APA family basic amino acid/polyamine antiporter
VSSIEKSGAESEIRSSTTSSGLFARNATGLVRGVSQRSSLVINFIPGHPTQALAAGFFFIFALFPGGNYLVGLALTIPLVLAIAYSFGLLTAMIPRSGGDYMIVSRVIHPVMGLVSSFCMTLAGLLSNAFFAVAFVTLGLGPGLVSLGLIERSQALINAGTTIQANDYWKFGIGAAMIALSAVFLVGGWRWSLRIQNTLFWVVTGGLILATITALFTSHASFVSSFNSFLRPYTHNANSYQEVLNRAAKAGVNLHPSFSVANSIPIVGFFATFSIYSYWSTFVAGELREASSVKTARNMALAGVTCIVVVAAFAAVYFHTFGTSFMIAANGGGMPPQVSTAPTYFFLMSGAVGNLLFAILVIFSYIFFWPLICYISLLQPTRMMFAYAFDGILPEKVTSINKSGAPWIAILISWVLSAATLLWGLNNASFFQIITYATLIQLIAMGLVSVCGIIVPWRRPELYRASTSQRTFLGVPVVTIAGVGGVITAVFVWVLFFHYSSQFGFSDPGKFFGFTGVTIGLAVVYYLLARFVRAREGVNIDLAYAEIPPE